MAYGKLYKSFVFRKYNFQIVIKLGKYKKNIFLQQVAVKGFRQFCLEKPKTIYDFETTATWNYTLIIFENKNC